LVHAKFFTDAEGRVKIASAFNQAIAKGDIEPLFWTDHHDVSGTDSPYETSNIYDGSRFTADMAIQNVIGDSFVVLLGYPFTMAGRMGEVIGFGMVLDGSKEALRRLIHAFGMSIMGFLGEAGLVTKELLFAIKEQWKQNPWVTIPTIVDNLLDF
jgi:urocanate hydratase